ncbi:YncE family protein [Deinococcus arcticus]|uniref:Anaphase-promoting complex subunit 4 WD40 domain-containing protein n=1 Tax=Deinococcus arcticus TaxID=2136176 RepID=A0A2T3WCW7_9DEIO|nr:hypothetical protein [Deinococcus arcticus]PTA69750.1 hypothetical protein C8263_01675 [Deinococcus arcticus]
MTRRFWTVLALSAALGPPAAAASLSPRTLLTVPGAAPLEVQPVFGGPVPSGTVSSGTTSSGLVACLGERLLHLGPGGEVRRSLPVGAPCAGLSVSPGGTHALTRTAAQVSVWRLSDGVRLVRLDTPGVTGAGFSGPQDLLIGSAQGVERLSLASPVRAAPTGEGVGALVTAPDGLRAVVTRAGRLQLLDTAGLGVQSALTCAAPCTLGPVAFSADGRVAAVQAGGELYALRAGYPASVVVRRTETGGAPLTGLPRRDGSVLVLRPGQLEVRDLQTGHREQARAVPGLQAAPATLTATERVLSVQGGALQDSGADLGAPRTLLSLPAVLTGGGLDPATGEPLALLPGGTLTAGPRALAQNVGAVQTMNRFTWLLTAGGSGGRVLSTFGGGRSQATAGLRSATRLSVNHWGNHAAVWDEARLVVVAQKTGKAVATLPVAGAARVTVSPDATRAYVFARTGDPAVVLTANAKRFPLPVQAGARYADVQISGQGQFAYVKVGGGLDLYRPGQRSPFAALPMVSDREGAVRYSPGNGHLAAVTRADDGWHLSLLDPETGRVTAVSPVLAEHPAFLAWSPDSRRLTVGAGLGTAVNNVTVFDVQ